MKVTNIVNQIHEVEGFQVKFYESPGFAFHGNATLGLSYDYKRAAPSKMTVSQWSKKRMNDLNKLGKLSVVVLDGEGKPVHGRATLKSVRGSYSK